MQPLVPTIQVELARPLERTGNQEEALKIAQSLLERIKPAEETPKLFAPILRIVARNLARQGDFAQAAEIFSSSLGKDPQLDLILELSRLYIAANDQPRALQLLENIREEDLPPPLIEAKADILVARQDPEHAAELIRSLVESKDASDLVLLKYARVLTSLGEHKQALPFRADLVQKYPKDRPLRRVYGEALAATGRRQEAILHLRESLGEGVR